MIPVSQIFLKLSPKLLCELFIFPKTPKSHHIHLPQNPPKKPIAFKGNHKNGLLSGRLRRRRYLLQIVALSKAAHLIISSTHRNSKQQTERGWGAENQNESRVNISSNWRECDEVMIEPKIVYKVRPRNSLFFETGWLLLIRLRIHVLGDLEGSKVL